MLKSIVKRIPLCVNNKSRSTVKPSDAFLSSCIGKYSCIYLFEIPKLSKEEKVYKYGYTNNLIRRNNEHCKTYGNDIKLKYHAYIPSYYLRDAEEDVKNYFEKADWVFEEYKQFKELVNIPDHSIKQTAEAYKLISEKYNISYESIQTENKLLKQIVLNKN